LRLGVAAVAVALAAVATTLVRPPSSDAAATAVVTVDAAKSLGALNNPVRYQNHTPLNGADLDLARQVGPPRIARVWLKPSYYYDETTGAYDYTNSDRSLDNAATYADQFLANVDECDLALMTLSSPQTCRTVLKTGLLHYKQRYPMLRWIELFNEPDKIWPPAPGEPPKLEIAEYYGWYKIAYSVVNEINAELKPDVPLRLGGPATYAFDTAYLTAFLDDFRSDTDPSKRLDFLSFHDYGHRDQPSAVGKEKQDVVAMLTQRGLDAATPLMVTESGVFAGGPDTPTGHGTTFSKDLLTQASAMATLGMYFVAGGMDVPMHWVYNHDTNERKSMFVDGVDGAVYPYFNVVAMQSMLKTTRVSSTASALSSDGIGVNALATSDDSGMAVLATNYQSTAGATSYSTRIDVKNLPARFTGRQILAERYLVDATTSNYDHDPADAKLRKVSTSWLPAGSTATTSFPLGVNATSLVVLTPMGHAEAESLTATASSGDTVTTIADTSASGGLLSKLGANAAGDFVSYPVQVAQAGQYRIRARMKTTPDRAVSQLSIDGVAQGAPVDTGSAGYGFVDEDFGIRTLAAGTRSFRFTLTGTTSGGWTLGVDDVQLVPVQTYRVEAESATPRVSPGAHAYSITDTSAGGGRLLKLAAGGVGDWMSFTVSAPAAGRYTLSLAGKSYLGRGIAAVLVNGVRVGEPVDQYAGTATFPQWQLGTIQLDRPGAVTIQCQIVGKQDASSGYEFTADYLQFAQAA